LTSSTQRIGNHAAPATVAVPSEEARLCGYWSLAFWIVAVASGAVACWIGRNSTNTDGISYMDLASAFSRHAWPAGINAYWSPLYPFTLGLALRYLKPTVYKEVSVVHAVNFLIFLGAAGAFEFFLSRLLRDRRQCFLSAPGGTWAFLPDWAMLALGYALFLWSSLEMITVSDISPDMLVALFVYLAAGMVLDMRGRPAGAMSFLALGAVLGFGYLAKAPMLPMGVIFLVMAALVTRDIGRAAAMGLPLAALAFLIVAGPFIAALSHAERHLTWGDSAKLNYAWYINHVPRYHWQGNLRGLGTPVHPTRKIHAEPAVYEFEGPKSATYPVWYDPAYWNDGVHLVFDWKSILQQIRLNVAVYYDVIFAQQSYLVVACALLFLIGGRGKLAWNDMAGYWMLLVPVAAALGMYVLVHVETRMIGAYIVLLWMALFATIRVENTPGLRKSAASGVIVIVLFTIFTLSLSMLGDLLSHSRAELTAWNNTDALPQWQVVKELNRSGIQPGDTVAWIRPNVFDDRMQNYSWARLARVQIVAEIPATDADAFWTASASEQAEVFDALAHTGAAALVVTKMPTRFSANGWIPLGKTGYFEYPLRNLSTR